MTMLPLWIKRCRAVPTQKEGENDWIWTLSRANAPPDVWAKLVDLARVEVVRDQMVLNEHRSALFQEYWRLQVVPQLQDATIDKVQLHLDKDHRVHTWLQAQTMLNSATP